MKVDNSINIRDVSKHNELDKNIILITLDAFNMELFMENLHSLPNLKKITDNGVLFLNAFSNGAMTKFSFPTIATSTYPYGYGIRIPKKIKTIDCILKEKRYNTAFINESQAFLTPFFGYNKCMDYTNHFLDFSHTKIDRSYKNIFLNKKTKNPFTKQSGSLILNLRNIIYDKMKARISNGLIRKIFNIIKRSIKYIDLIFIKHHENYKDRMNLHILYKDEIKHFINNNFKRPQFLWIHTIANHLPYLPSNTNKFSEKTINYLNYRGISLLVNYYTAKNLKSLFIESLITTDRLIGDILFNLNKNGLLDDSIIIITADHGEEFYEEGYFGHLIKSSSDLLLRVPLIFYSPTMFKNKKITIPVSTMDILPTIADLVNIKKLDIWQGISLIDLLLQDAPEKPLVDKFLWRPLFSHGWKTSNLFDLRPAYKSTEQYFTVRLNKYKLKVKKTTNDERDIECALENWVDNEKLDVTSHSLLVKELMNLLTKHISEQIILF